MPVTVIERGEPGGRTVAVDVRGTLTRQDYDLFVPRLETLIERHGSINFLVRFQEFEGIEPGALWEDIKFDVRHFNDFERVAIVGEQRWMKAIAAFCKPFTRAEVRVFEPDRFDDAAAWVSEPVASSER